MLVRGFARENAQGRVELSVPLFGWQAIESKDQRSFQKLTEDISWIHLKNLMHREIKANARSYNAQTGEVILDVETEMFFAALVREHRKAQKLSYEQLARKCKKISRGYICDIEHGRVTPTPATLEKTLGALDVALG
jgi:ribosome-binding protein aMBF1 (putative translation factor)